MLLAFVACSVAVVYFQTDRLLREERRGSLVEIAQICAAALVPGVNGDLSESVERLRGRYSGLVAVVTLDVAGRPHTFYPDRPAHREAALAVLANQDATVELIAPDSGERMVVSGVSVSLSGPLNPWSRKALVLFAPRIGSPDTTGFILWLSCALGAAALICSWSMRHWFERHVATPLRAMTRAVEVPDNLHDSPTVPQTAEWSETCEFTSRVHELVDHVMTGRAAALRAARNAESRLVECERGFDRKLRRVRDQVTMDALTGLRNRSFFEAELELLVARQRDGDADLAAIMIDVDNFKQYNDAHGHQEGDNLLRFVGALLQGAVRPGDHAIRYGGDEFLLLLPETSGDQARAVGTRLVKLFGQHVMGLKAAEGLSISAGVASLVADEVANGHDLVARADAALYAAKRGGKSAVRSLSALSTRACASARRDTAT